MVCSLRGERRTMPRTVIKKQPFFLKQRYSKQASQKQIVTDNCQFFCYRQVQYLQVLFASYEKRPMLVFME